jgi:exopolysaccharide biosynthesis polyprenyl glycosylphosphotransferase
VSASVDGSLADGGVGSIDGESRSDGARAQTVVRVGEATARSSVTPHNRVSALYRHLARRMLATDAACLVVGMLVAYIVRFGAAIQAGELATMAFGAIALVLVFRALHLGDIEHLGPAEEFRRLVLGVGISVALLAFASFWSQASYSRLWLGLTWVLTTGLVLVTRQIWHRRLGRMRNDGRLVYRTLVVSGFGEAKDLAGAISSPGLGFQPVGLFHPPSLLRAAVKGNGHAGGRQVGLSEAIDMVDAECMFVSSATLATTDMDEVMKTARLRGIEVRLSANLPSILAARMTIRPFGNFLAVSVKPVRLTGLQVAMRRSFDVLVAALAMVVIAPVWLGITLAIKLTSRGPVLYRQVRVGRDGSAFTMFKFRTMVKGAEGMTEGLIDLNHADGPLFKIPDDPRLTRAGKWLRRYSLDELPQLLNVLLGHMSLVGPRPPLPEEVSAYEDWHHERLTVTPGMTGLWQVSGRSDLPFDEYVRLDLFYIENWSVAYDLYILAKTIPVVLSGKGSY